MPHSTVTSKGQTTIPSRIRELLNIRAGDRIEYTINGDHATIRVHGGLSALKGALSSKRGKNLSFKQIREAAASASREASK